MPEAICVTSTILVIIASMASDYIHATSADDLVVEKMTCVELHGRRILIANVDGVFYATDDTCTHEDASLSNGSLKGGYVKCPLHGSRFDLRTGEAMEDPAEDPLRCYPVKVEQGKVLVKVPSPRHE